MRTQRYPNQGFRVVLIYRHSLEERFSIVCKDSIADALHSRREELKASDFKARNPIPILNATMLGIIYIANAWMDFELLVECRNALANPQYLLETG